jgi:hypothetical protein
MNMSGQLRRLPEHFSGGLRVIRMVAYDVALATGVKFSGCTTHESEARNKDSETVGEPPDRRSYYKAPGSSRFGVSVGCG